VPGRGNIIVPPPVGEDAGHEPGSSAAHPPRRRDPAARLLALLSSPVPHGRGSTYRHVLPGSVGPEQPMAEGTTVTAPNSSGRFNDRDDDNRRSGHRGAAPSWRRASLPSVGAPDASVASADALPL